jgi:Polyketide cyclase / dehydrase and lipid transport
MAVDVTTEIEIHRPRAEVAAYASDLDCTTEWYENITSVSWQTSKPAVVGCPGHVRGAIPGSSHTVPLRDRGAPPRRAPRHEHLGGRLPDGDDLAWIDSPEGGTRMTLRNRGEPSGFATIATPAMAAAMRRANRNDLRRLKTVLERQRS